MIIKEILEEDRPREKLLQGNYLTDSELLAIILRTGTKNLNVVDLARNLLKKFPLNELNKSSIQELQSVSGIGFAKACQIVAMFEIQKRINPNKTKIIKSAKDVFNYCSHMSFLDRERFVVLFLDTRNKVIKEEIVSIGTLNGSLVHPREVFKNAIKESANSVIFVHNHPSGDCSPSDEDKEVTEQLFKIGEMLNIKVLDHVIVGKNDFYSFKN